VADGVVASFKVSSAGKNKVACVNTTNSTTLGAPMAEFTCVVIALLARRMVACIQHWEMKNP
jgi:hypothetical protein